MEWWGAGMVISLERGANDLHMVQLMPLPPIISCFIKIQHIQVVLEKRPLNGCLSVLHQGRCLALTLFNSTWWKNGSLCVNERLSVSCVVVVECKESSRIRARCRWHNWVDWREGSASVVGGLRTWCRHRAGAHSEAWRLRGHCQSWIYILLSCKASDELYTLVDWEKKKKKF